MNDSAPTPEAISLPLRVIPLGGVGIFGMNCTVLEYGGHMIMVDAGFKIPQGNYPGVDLILPDFTYVLENLDRLKAIFLTHGHDDHIGSLPYLLRQVDVPVYGTALTLALVRERLTDSSGNGPPVDGDLRQIMFRDPVTCGPFNIEAVRVAHSIPDGAALIIRTPVGIVVHSGDYKMDQAPIDGNPTDLAGLAKAGEMGVLLLMSDSTNADRPGFTRPEAEVGRVIEDLMRQAPGRVFIATFASHIHRIQQILNAAEACGRKAVVEGRRMIGNSRLASDLGYLHVPSDVLISMDNAGEQEAGKLVYLVTGSQGEPMSALSRIARGEHSGVKVGNGDTVIFSSRIIPGNELAAGSMIDGLFRAGARVYYQGSPMVHVSGHGSAEEIKLMINAVKPRFFIPLHGDYRQLVACSRLAQQVGIEKERIFILDPGQVLEFSEDTAFMGASVPAGRMLVDGDLVTDLGSPLMKERRRLAREGLVVVVASLSARGEPGSIAPSVHSVGVGLEESSRSLDREAEAVAKNFIRDWRSPPSSIEELREEIRIGVRAVYRRALQKKPMVIPVLVEE
ncbi:MAG: ribonuclease J [Deltaproteobacteria bacterium]|nr:ribonuclease J [Deltaproteobacteria bacterium]